MTLQHMDNFSVYGTVMALLTNGIYAQANGDQQLVADPDGISPGRVLRQNSSAASYPTLRYIYPLAQPVVGSANRVWMNILPTGGQDRPKVFSWRNAANSEQAYLMIESTGQLIFNDTGTAGGTTNFITPAPVMTANGWWHIEAKYTRSGGGSIEVRVEGITVISITGLGYGAVADIAQTAFHGPQSNFSSAVKYMKDLAIWDGQGTQNNNFLGSVIILDLTPDTDVALNWDKSSPLFSGADLLRDLVPFNILTASGALASGNQVRINNTYYNWTSGSVDTGAPAGTSANPWLVNMGASTTDALLNMFKAINASGVAGTDYSTALTINTFVGASGVSATQLGIVALNGVSLYTCTETGANTAWAAGAMFVGVNDMSFISAPNPPPAAYECSLSNLPVNVTSVRGLMTMVRAMKSDGGDGSLQVSLISGASTDDGANRPITATMNYWLDISELDPDTAAPWTPLAVDAVTMKINRTV